MGKVLTFGELLLRISPDEEGQWLHNNQLPFFIAGAELNVATALNLWGIPVRYQTALPDNGLARQIVSFEERQGIEMAVDYRGQRLGLYFLTKGRDLKNDALIYDLIKKYVEDNEIDRPIDMVIKSAANKSALKVYIIQNIDRHLNLEDIAASKGLTYEEILREVESIVNSGTKLNLNYFIDEVIDEDKQEEVYDYFRTAEIDSIDHALAELGTDDYTREEVQLMRIKFLSEMGN